MFVANNLAFAKSMEAAKWVALVVAALGLALLFTDLIMNIKKRQHTRLNIVALVFLSVSLICFILTQWVIKNLPPFMSLIWIAFLVGYLVCDIILAVGIGKDNRRKKKAEQASVEEGAESQGEVAESETEVESHGDVAESAEVADEVVESQAKKRKKKKKQAVVEVSSESPDEVTNAETEKGDDDSSK